MENALHLGPIAKDLRVFGVVGRVAARRQAKINIQFERWECRWTFMSFVRNLSQAIVGRQ